MPWLPGSNTSNLAPRVAGLVGCKPEAPAGRRLAASHSTDTEHPNSKETPTTGPDPTSPVPARSRHWPRNGNAGPHACPGNGLASSSAIAARTTQMTFLISPLLRTTQTRHDATPARPNGQSHSWLCRLPCLSTGIVRLDGRTVSGLFPRQTSRETVAGVVSRAKDRSYSLGTQTGQGR